MKKVTVINKKKPELPRLKRVAAYCRVSEDLDKCQHSLSTQISYFNNLIQSDTGWDFAGVFYDKGISGTSTKKREGFQSMMTAAEEGKIDLILAKSIQRFARNTVDLLSSVRRLKELGVEVQFEKENISTMDSGGELMLTLLASIAQEESLSLSENVKWSKLKKYKAGRPISRFKVFGYEWIEDDLVIIPEEAEIIRFIYEAYEECRNCNEVSRRVNKLSTEARTKNTWGPTTITETLRNSIYTGELVLQKVFIENPFTKRVMTNNGQLPKFIIDQHHEAIISPEQFNRVQKLMIEKKNLGIFSNEFIQTSFLTQKIKCGDCGHFFIRATCQRSNGEKWKKWICSGTRPKKTPKCKARISIPEELLLEFIAQALENDSFSEEDFSESISEIIVCNRQHLLFKFKNGRETKIDWESRYLEWRQVQKANLYKRRSITIANRSPEEKEEMARRNREAQLNRSPEAKALTKKKIAESRNKWTPEHWQEINKKISITKKKQAKAKREAKLAALNSKESTD